MKKISLTLAILMVLTMFASCGKEATTESTKVEDTPVTVEFTEVEETEIEETEPAVDPDDHYYWFIENIPAVENVFSDLDWYVSDDQHGKCYTAGVENCDESTYATYLALVNRDMFPITSYEEKYYVDMRTGDKHEDHYGFSICWEDDELLVICRFVPAK